MTMTMTMKRLAAILGWIDLRALAIIATAAAMLHIVATLAAPDLAREPAFSRLEARLPANTMTVLPPIAANAQPLPFTAPDALYAMCRFDTAASPVEIKAQLPAPGWTISIYTSRGESIYTAAGQNGQPTDISLKLVPSGDRFTGLTPEARGLQSNTQPQLAIAARHGVVVVRAPERGIAYRAAQSAALAAARCAPTTG